VSRDYDWRNNSPGVETVQLIRERLLQASTTLRSGTATFAEGLDLCSWAFNVNLEAIQPEDREKILTLLNRIVDALVVVPPDRPAAESALDGLLAFLAPSSSQNVD
jgi:hypothetical protein